MGGPSDADPRAQPSLMFLGHIAIGFASKRAAPQTNLGWLIAAPLFLDLLWPFFLLAGLETVRVAPGDTAFTPLRFVSYPYTHSLIGCLLWAALLALVYAVVARNGRGALVLLGGVVSHWVLDVVTHRADMPVGPRGPYLGLGLWNWVAATVAIELLMMAVGLCVYLYATRPRKGSRGITLWALVLLLVMIYGAQVGGPPPPDEKSIAYVGLALWLAPLWAAFADSRRRVRRS